MCFKKKLAKLVLDVEEAHEPTEEEHARSALFLLEDRMANLRQIELEIKAFRSWLSDRGFEWKNDNWFPGAQVRYEIESAAKALSWDLVYQLKQVSEGCEDIGRRLQMLSDIFADILDKGSRTKSLTIPPDEIEIED